jgi:perosamine synthetase
VHQLGLAADMDALEDLARQHALMIVEDGACALGSTYHGRQIGASSRSCCFSFHPRKIITTGEGGMITTDDAEIAARLRTLRSQGIPSDALSRAQRGQLDAEPIRELGYNYRMTDIQAAVGIVQMERLPLLLERRRRLARRYDELLDRLGEVARPEDPWLDPQTGTSSHAYQSYMVVLDSERSRAAAVRYLQRQQIASRPGITAIHEQPLYQRSGRSRRLPNTERLARRGLLLPLYADLTEAEQDRVVQALAAALG